MSRRQPASAGSVDAVLLPSLGNLSLNKREDAPASWPQAEDIEGSLLVDGGDGEKNLMTGATFEFDLLNLAEEQANKKSKWVKHYKPVNPPEGENTPYVNTWTSFYPGGENGGVYHANPHFMTDTALQEKPLTIEAAHKPLFVWVEKVDKWDASDATTKKRPPLPQYANLKKAQGNASDFIATLGRVQTRGKGLEPSPLPPLFWTFMKKNVPTKDQVLKIGQQLKDDKPVTYKALKTMYVGPIYSKWGKESKEARKGWRMAWADTPKKAWLLYLGYMTSACLGDKAQVDKKRDREQQYRDQLIDDFICVAPAHLLDQADGKHEELTGEQHEELTDEQLDQLLLNDQQTNDDSTSENLHLNQDSLMDETPAGEAEPPEGEAEITNEEGPPADEPQLSDDELNELLGLLPNTPPNPDLELPLLIPI